MISPTAPTVRPALQPGMVVALNEEFLGLPAPGDTFVPVAGLGPGIVEKVARSGQVRVRWMDAELDTWMDPAELCPRPPHTHLITVYECDGRGTNTRLRHQLVETESLEYNWTVEFRPDHVVRVIRAGGAAWTFHIFPDIRGIHTSWPHPPEDADAEALTVAELALGWTWTEI
jgi:hypothetical protein